MKRSRLHTYFEGDKGSPDYHALEDELQSLREGTREQFESDWTHLPPTGAEAFTVTFTHLLGEIPWTVDVIRSESEDGSLPVTATTFTVAKTDTTITLANDSTDTAYYFKVRAL